MTQEEVARKIVNQGNCAGISCYSDNCPMRDQPCGLGSLAGVSKLAKEWLESHGGNMDKNEAIKRLDAIEKEQAELRKIIEKGDKIVYDSDLLYIGMYSCCPYIMAGCDQDGFVFYTLEGTNNSDSYSKCIRTGQECIDYHVEEGFDIHIFDDTKEALQFFIDHL